MVSRRAIVITLFVSLAAACSGGSSPSTPTSPTTPTTPGIDACAAIAGTSSISGTVSPQIVNGTACTPTSSAVVMLNLIDSTGVFAQCSGTIIGPRSILTAAHCLPANTTKVQMYAGDATNLPTTQTFAAYPGYQENTPNALDVGVVTFGSDIGRNPIPVLLSRDARVGETAVISGWGKDQNQVAATLRAGTAAITAVDSVLIHTQFTTNASSVCQGDSGGPLLLQEGGAWAIAGVVSANQTTACAFGENFFAEVRNSQISSFIVSKAPDAARR